MSPDRAAWTLANPLSGKCDLSPYRVLERQQDGALLQAILAVDR